MSRTYSPSSYDDNFCLKPPGLLWLAVLYLSRAFLLLVIYVVSSVSHVSPEAMATLRGTVSIYAFVPSLVAAPVLFALLHRAPSSTALIRWIWAHGRTFLTLAAILDSAASLGSSGLIDGDAANPTLISLLAALFDIYFLVYILATRRVRDAFADFPPAAAVTSGAQRRG
jgi:hypothetical protein